MRLNEPLPARVGCLILDVHIGKGVASSVPELAQCLIRDVTIHRVGRYVAWWYGPAPTLQPVESCPRGGPVKFTSDPEQNCTESCRVLGLFRRRLVEGSMLPEDVRDLVQILEWVEEHIVMARLRAHVAPRDGK